MSAPQRHQANALSEGHFVLLVEHEEFVSAMVHRVEALPPDGDGVVRVAPRLEKGATLEGTVLRPDGAPGAGATVVLKAQAEPAQPVCVTFERGATADAGGRFEVTGLRRSAHRMEIEAPGCAPHTRTVDLSSGAAEPLRIRMAGGSDLEGVVLHRDGTPIPSTPVFAILRGPWYAALTPKPPTTRRTETDAQGRFRLAGLPARGRIRIRALPSIETVVSLPATRVTLRGPALVDLRLSLVAAESGAPLGPPGYVTVMAPGFSTILEAGEGGICLRPDMPEGKYMFMGDAPDRAVAVKRARVPAEGLAAPIEIRLRKGASVRGRVTGPGGAPVAGASVVAHGWMFGHERRAATDASGRYELKGLGRYAVLVVSAGDLALRVRTLWSLGLPGPARALDLQLGEGATVGGRVTRADGTPAAGVLVKVSRPGLLPVPFNLPSAVTDGDGRFELRHVPEGRFTLSSGTATRRIRARHGAAIDVALRIP
jgi:hypothetical protein